MVNRQIFRAPEIPRKKIGRRTIKSAAITGAVQPQLQLKKSTFSFIKPVTNLLTPEKLVTSNIIEKESIIKKIIEPIINNKIVKIFQSKNILQSIDKTPQGVEETLEETNRILVEIQKQLSLDFASRIIEDKKYIRSEKLKISKERVSNKEKVIEGTQKLSSGIGKVFDKITSPVKSIFQKILDFFSTILTGILVNAAFRWLEKKENREKVYKFITFLGDHWKEILIIIGATKLLGLLSKIVKVAKIFKNLLGLFKKTPPPSSLGGGNPCNQVLDCMGNPAYSSAFVTSSIAAIIANAQLRDYIKNVAQGSYFPGAQPALPLVPQNPLTLPTPQQPDNGPVLDPFTGKPLVPLTGKPEKIEEVLSSPEEPNQTAEKLKQQRRKEDIEKFKKQFTPGGYSVQNIQNAQERAKPPNGISKAEWLKIVGDIASVSAAVGAILIPADGPVLDSIAIANLVARGIVSRQTVLQIVKRSGSQAAVKVLEKTLSPQPVVARSMGGTIPILTKPEMGFESPKKKCTACSLGFSGGGTIPGFSLGGTVGGKGSGTVDSVPALLAPREEVIKAPEAMRWRPLLKDINDNGARLWQAFTNAITRQENTNTDQAENNLELSEILDNYEKVLKSEEQRLKQKYLASLSKNPPRRPTRPSSPPSTPAQSTTPSSAPAPGPATQSTSPMPDASRTGSPGIPGDPTSPKIGDKVGKSPSPQPQPLSASTQNIGSPAPAPPVEGTRQPPINPGLINAKTPTSFQNVTLLKEQPIGSLLAVQSKPQPNLRGKPQRPVITTLPTQTNYIPLNSGNNLRIPEAPAAYVPEISPVNPFCEEQMFMNMLNLGVIT